MARLRLYLTGRVTLEHGPTLVDEQDLAGRQGRLALAFLAATRHRPASREELVSVIWPDSPPRGLDVSLSAILSKLRAVFKRAGLSEREAGIDVRMGTTALRVPLDTWIDLEAVGNAIDEAEGALRRGDRAMAWGSANVAVSIGRRPFLSDEEALWIEARRVQLRTILVRGLHCLATTSASNSELALAVQYLQEIIALEPFRETAYQELMRTHAHAGNRAEALRVFGRCRELLREELGASPSPATQTLFLEILRQGE